MKMLNKTKKLGLSTSNFPTPPIFRKLGANKKPLKFLFFILVLIFTLSIQGSMAQIRIDGDGDIGIGTSAPQTDVHIKGDYIKIETVDPEYAPNHIKIHRLYQHPVIEPSSNQLGYVGYNNYWYTGKFYHIYWYFDHDYSDKRMKENIKNLETSTLDKVLQLRPVKYDFKESVFTDSDGKKNEKLIEEGKDQIGLIAQEVLKVFPEVTHYDEDKDEYSLSYSRMVPILIKAIQEQQAQIEALKLKDKTKEEQLKSLTLGEVSSLVPSNASLNQNNPNPFSDQTEISFYIPKEVSNATINIYSLNGSLIHSYSITDRGNASLVIAGYQFDPGIYLYNMILDKQVADTKQMVLTD